MKIKDISILLLTIPVTIGTLVTPFIINSCSCNKQDSGGGQLTIPQQLEKFCKDHAIRFAGDSSQTYDYSNDATTDDAVCTNVTNFLTPDNSYAKHIIFNG
jgi:hypothetical protein